MDLNKYFTPKIHDMPTMMGCNGSHFATPPAGDLGATPHPVSSVSPPATTSMVNVASLSVDNSWSEQLKRRVLKLGRMVQSSITHAMTAVCAQDKELATAVIKEDEQIDQMEIAIEEYCLTILEQIRPVREDLRLVVAVLKINATLERIGDLAENIAKAVRKVDDWDGFERVPGCQEMAERSHAMLRRALESLVTRDAQMARHVMHDDHFIDDLRAEIEKKLAAAMDESTASSALLRLEYVTRQLERIGDLATNIAEDVILMITGHIVRHPHRFDGDDNIVLDRAGRRFRRRR